MARKLTKRTVDSIHPGDERGSWHADSELPGFFLVSYASGKKVFFVRYRVRGVRRVMKVGLYGRVTPEAAREKAKELLSTAELGGDPASDRKRERTVPLFGAWVDEYLRSVRHTKKAPKVDERFLGQAVERWKLRSLDSLERPEIDACRQGIVSDAILRWRKAQTDPEALPAATKGRALANRWLASVRACLAAAVRAGYLKANPASDLKPYQEAPPRARVLAPEEMERLLRCLEHEPDPHAKAAIRMLVETGARLSEVLRAKWPDIDFAAGMWRIPSPKTGKPQVVPLAAATTKMLRRLPRASAYVIAGKEADGRQGDRPRADLKGPWARLTAAAQLHDVHVHDLRRTFGLAVAKAAGLHVASKLLRHGDVRITEKVYAPLGIEDLRAAMEQRAQVLPFTARKRARRSQTA